MGGLRNLLAGTCCAWPLPLDASCAKAARQLYREAAAEVGITVDLLYDGITMASELAANTLHAQLAAGPTGSPRPLPARPELWLYLRGSGTMRELVCKVFDACPGWKRGDIPGPVPLKAPAGAMSGRGLQIVHELSQGRWGHHLTRARLDGRKVRGKAVWFALPVPPAAAPGLAAAGAAKHAELTAIQRCRQLSARQATEELEAMLAARGLASRLLRADQPAADLSVLRVSRGLTVSCRDGSVSLRTPAGDSQRWTYADLVDVIERAVSMHEEMEHAPPGSAQPEPAVGPLSPELR